MAFSMKDVKRGGQTKRNNMLSCFGYIKNEFILTEGVQEALCQYVNYRFVKRNHSSFTANKLREMTRELLEFVLHRKFEDITLQDVINNESQIIYEIGKAIYYGAIYHLYYVPKEGQDSATIDFNSIKFKKPQVARLSEHEQLSREKIKKYFEDLMI